MRPHQPAFLAAATGASATHAAVARPVTRHDRAAVVAAGGVAQVDDGGERVGRMDRSRTRFGCARFGRSMQVAHAVGGRRGMR